MAEESEVASRSDKSQPKSTLWQRFANWLDARRLAYLLIAAAALVLALGLLGKLGAFDGLKGVDEIINDFYANLVTDFLSIALTVLVLDTLNERRNHEERKKAIIQQMGSPVNDAAREAVRIARIEGWLEDGSLRSARLIEANLREANLEGANLEEADLRRINLQGAKLESANLQGAILVGANLQGAGFWDAQLQKADLTNARLQEANLWKANLQGAKLELAKLHGAKLWNAYLQEADLNRADLQGAKLSNASLQVAHVERANLQEANLENAHLQGAVLREADLRGADLSDANFDETTQLPDLKQWTPDTDLARFTDAEHPQFYDAEKTRALADDYRDSADSFGE